MSGYVPLLPLYAFIRWTGKVSPLRIRSRSVSEIRKCVKCVVFLNDAVHMQGVGTGLFDALPDSSHTILNVEQVSLNLNGSVVQLKLNKTGNVFINVTLRRVRVTIAVVENQ